MSDTAHKPTSRADQVRERRREALKKEVQPVAAPRPVVKPPAKAQAAPTGRTNPVMVRGRTFGTPVVQSARSEVRRKFAIPLGAPGVELMTPAFPVIKPGWRLLSGTLTLVFAALLVYMSFMPMFQVRTLQIGGLQRLHPSDIETFMGLGNIPLYLVDPAGLKARIEEAFPELIVNSAGVNLPGTVTLDLKERNPLVAWQYANLTVWIDEDGYLFPPRGEAVPAIVVQAETPPLLEPAPPPDPLAEIHLSGVQATPTPEEILSLRKADPVFVEGVRRLSSKLLPGMILTYTLKDGFGWQDPGGWKVLVGMNMDDLEQKLAMYQFIIDQLVIQDIYPAVISVKNVHAPYYRLEP